MLMKMESMKPRILEPNLFELRGYDMRIIYSTGSRISRFSYCDRDQVFDFSGSEIRVDVGGLGRIITVTLPAAQVREGTESLSLLLPIVYLPSETEEIAIKTKAIFSKRISKTAVLIPGQLQTYDTFALYGTAQWVGY
jgi:hypothetical protein